MMMEMMIKNIRTIMMMVTTYDKHGKLLGLQRNTETLPTSWFPNLSEALEVLVIVILILI